MTNGDGLSPGEVQRVQALAWVLIALGTLAATVLAIGGPLLALGYARSATSADRATVEPKVGSVAVQSPAGMPILLQGFEPREVGEGSWISTDGTSKAFVQFADGSTLHLAPTSRVQLMTVRRNRFRFGRQPRQIRIWAEPNSEAESRFSAGVAWGDTEYTILTPHATVAVRPEGRVRFRLSRDSLTVVVAAGEAEVNRGSERITLLTDQRAVVERGGSLRGPLPALENRLYNAEFAQVASESSTPVGWTFDRQVPAATARSDPGRALVERLPDGRRVLAFDRQGAGGTPGTLLYTQSLEHLDAGDCSYLGVSATLRITVQSLPGGGTERTEFPAILNLVYESASGDDYRWRVGFYAQPPRPDDPRRMELEAYDVQVPMAEWYRFESGNLLEQANPFGFAAHQLPVPVRFRRFEIVASGHDFASQVDEVGLWLK